MTLTPQIEFQQRALLRVLLALFAFIGMSPDGSPLARLPKPIRVFVLRVLGPAESAARRLFFALSRSMPRPEPRAGSTKKSGCKKTGRGSTSRVRPPVFWLFDPRKYFAELSNPNRRFSRGPGPRMSFFDGEDPEPDSGERSPVRDPDDAMRLCRRMQALYHALNNMPAQAQRLLRMMAKRRTAPPGPGRYGPLRPGWPPGYRKNWTHQVDEILYDCHIIARTAPSAPDSS